MSIIRSASAALGSMGGANSIGGATSSATASGSSSTVLAAIVSTIAAGPRGAGADVAPNEAAAEGDAGGATGAWAGPEGGGITPKASSTAPSAVSSTLVFA